VKARRKGRERRCSVERARRIGSGELGPAAADDWACTSHTRTSLILECVRLGIEDGATAAADPQTLHRCMSDRTTTPERGEMWKRGGEEREVLRLMWRDAENKVSACVKARGKDDSEEEESEVVGRRRKGERIRPNSG
jgi:hypothetical protein